MDEVTIHELIKYKKCLDKLYDGVNFELHDSIYVDTQDNNMEGIDCLTKAIIEVFYAWLNYHDIKINLKDEG